MFCTRCGKEILNEAVVCVHCGCSTRPIVNVMPTPAPVDPPSIGMSILGFFIPLAGFIIWLVNKDTKPGMAKSAGVGALIGFGISIVFSFLSAIILAATGALLY